MRKTKNGYTIILNEWDNYIIVKQGHKLIAREAFSDAIKARIAFNNL